MDPLEQILVEAGKLGVIIYDALQAGVPPNKIAILNQQQKHMVLSTEVTGRVLAFAVQQQTERNK